jgi:uncharacterized protein (DUF885 family)
MSKTKKTILFALLVLVLAAAVFVIPTLWGKPWSIDHFYARVFGTFAFRHPMMLSSMRLLEPVGLRFHNDDLDDMSEDFARYEADWMEEQLDVLRSYDRASMTDEEGLSYDVLEWFMEDQKEGNRYALHNYPLNQMGGVQSGLPDFMITTHHLGDARDAKDYIARVSKFGVALDQVLGGLEEREEAGIIPPKFVIAHVLDQMRDFVDRPPTEQVLYTHFATESEKLEDLKETERAELLKRLESRIQGNVYPAYGKLIEYFEELDRVATTDDGVWKLPDGFNFYNWTLAHHTTTDLSADEIHELGLLEVERIQTEMRGILLSQDYEIDDLAATMNALNEEERFLYPDTDEGREQIIADYQAMIDEIDAGLSPMFDVRPSSGVKVERVPEFRQATAPGAYYNGPAFDGSRPGIFFINLRSVKEIPKFGMRTLAYHEAIPGHHFQIAVAQEIEGVPFFRRIIPFTAYTEGWALYAEELAAENGFQEDPFDRLGYLTAQVFRAVRLVVDTGIHRMRWTREQAIEYMLENTGMPETDVVAEIERYIVNPGQATAYMVGRLKIVALRDHAQERLGEAFDIREFHNVMLGNGAVPLSILEQLVDRWIEEKLGSSA